MQMRQSLLGFGIKKVKIFEEIPVIAYVAFITPKIKVETLLCKEELLFPQINLNSLYQMILIK